MHIVHKDNRAQSCLIMRKSTAKYTKIWETDKKPPRKLTKSCAGVSYNIVNLLENQSNFAVYLPPAGVVVIALRQARLLPPPWQKSNILVNLELLFK